MQIFSVLFDANVFEFCWQHFPNDRSFGIGMINSSASCLRHKCREHGTICVLKLVLLWLLFSV